MQIRFTAEMDETHLRETHVQNAFAYLSKSNKNRFYCQIIDKIIANFNISDCFVLQLKHFVCKLICYFMMIT